MERLTSIMLRVPDLIQELPALWRVLRHRPHRPTPPTVRLRLALRRARRTLTPRRRAPRDEHTARMNVLAARRRCPNLDEKWHHLLHRLHGFRAGVGLGLGLLIVLVHLSLVFGLMSDVRQPDAAPGVLVAIAVVLAAVAGFLLAVAVFALQAHAQSLGHATFLTQYLTRREGLVPIAAVLLSVIAANLCSAAIGLLWLPAAARVMLFLDFPVVLLALALTLWLFYRLVTSVSGDFLNDCVIPGIRWEYERSLLAPESPHSAQCAADLVKLGQTVVDQAKYDSPDRFRRSLDVVESLLDAWLKHESPDLGTTPLYPLSLSDDPLEMGQWRMRLVDGVIASRHRDKIEALFQLCDRTLIRSISAESQATFSDACGMIVRAYLGAIRSEDKQVADLAGSLLDAHTLPITRARLGEHGPAKLPLLVRYLSCAIELTESAAKAARAGDAARFLDHLLPFDAWDHERFVGAYRGGPKTPDETRLIDQLHVVAGVVVAARLLDVFDQGGKTAPVAAELFQNAVCRLGHRQDVLAAWETITESDRQVPGKLCRWIFSHRERWADPEPWFKGLVAAVLSRPQAPHGTQYAQAKTASTASYDLDRIERVARSLLEDETIRQQLLAIPDNEQGRRLQEVLALFRSRNQAYALCQLRRAVSGRLADTRRDRLRNEIRQALHDHRHLFAALKALGGLQEPAALDRYSRVTYARHVPKVDFLDGQTEPFGLGQAFARELGRCEDRRIAEILQTGATPLGHLADMADLPDALAQSIGTLYNRGYRPRMIFLPQNEAFAEALFGMPPDAARDHARLGPDHLGRWEQTDAFRWPVDMDAACIVVLDPAGFYGRCDADEDQRLTLDMQEPNADLHRQWLAQADRHPESIDPGRPVDVIAVAHLLAAAGLRDPHAAARIDVALQSQPHA
ncbi:MAG: hypothetical protein JXQ73_10320 [Phycisphaerae bacterium]|nr:hypothetical protein [Phycisphaerae bacterium]